MDTIYKDGKMRTIEMNKHDLIRYFGSSNKAADALLISYPAISKWPVEVPPQSAWAANWISSGSIECKINVEKLE